MMNSAYGASNEADLAGSYLESRDLSDFETEGEPIEVRRNVTISVRFSDAEIETLRRKAEDAGVKVTAFIRAAALEASSPVDPAQIRDAVRVMVKDLAVLECVLTGRVEASDIEANVGTDTHVSDAFEMLVARTLRASSVTSGKFEVFQDRSGKFRYRLKARNGHVVATGEAYKTRRDAERGAAAAIRAATGAALVDLAD